MQMHEHFNMVPITLKTRYDLREDVIRLHSPTDDAIGGGCNASVYPGFDDNTVVKIAGHDIGYMAYVKLIDEFQLNNRYLPKIFSAAYWHDATNVKNGVYVIHMEKLTTIPYRSHLYLTADGRRLTLGNVFYDFLSRSYKEYGTNAECTYLGEQHSPVQRFSKILNSTGTGWMEGGELTWKLRSEHQDALTLIKLAKDFAREHTEYQVDYDINMNNVMLRNGRQMVITDPLC